MGRLRLALAALVVAAAAAASAAGDGLPGYTLTQLGRAVGATELGENPTGLSGAADGSALRLADGRVRLYFFDMGASILRSAISTDGVHFTVEPGTRAPAGQAWGQPRAVALADGRVRLFFIDAGGIGSAVSSDGLTFTKEPGLRVSATDAGVAEPSFLSTGTIVMLADGRYRMYFSTLHRPGAAIQPERVQSAVSSDMLSWTIEPGVRVGAGAALAGSAEHPFALARADGSVTLFYGRNQPFALYASTSSDGLSFTSESQVIERVLDSDVLADTSGTYLLYFGTHDETAGNSVAVARLAPASTTTTPPPTVKPKPKTKPTPKCKQGQKTTKNKPCRR